MDLFAKMKIILEKTPGPEAAKAAALQNAKAWLTDEALTDYRPYIDHLIRTENGNLLLDAFWRVIPFGTGGRRGPVGAGPNRINPHTIALSVQGHCDYLRNVVGLKGDISVVVAFDVRRFFDLRGLYPGVDGILKNLTSRDLARMSAMTYAANGVTAYVIGALENEPGISKNTTDYISTPELSFLIRELKAAGGLNISASHNHPDDNGGKFYNADGGQEIPPNDEALLQMVDKVAAVKTMPYLEARQKNLIRFVPKELHTAYIKVNTDLCPAASRSARIGYSPLSGTGVTTVKEALLALNFDVTLVEEQAVPDGSFKSVCYRIANPEVPESMDKLKALLIDEKLDLGLSTDPDADRLGVLVPDGKGDFQFVNGNEIGIVLIEAILQAKKKNGTLPASPIFINTLVTSSLQRKIAKAYGCQVVGDLMVGFKYMGDVLRNLEAHGKFPPAGEENGRDTIQGSIDDFVFTTEESHGYLVTPRVRDKDACGAAVFLSGFASLLKDEDRTILDFLNDIYRVYGYTSSRLRSMVMEGITGLDRINRIQQVLRKNPPSEIAGLKVLRFVDHQTVGGPITSGTDEAGRNVLLFELQGTCPDPIRLVVRPSGTEPKTKIYIEVPSIASLGGKLMDTSRATLESIGAETLAEIKSRTDAEADRIANEFVRYCLGPKVLPDAFPIVPSEALLVSDLVSVEHKIRLVTKILPALVEQLEAEVAEPAVGAWLAIALKPLGEDPLGLIRPAARAWLANRKQKKGIAEQAARVLGIAAGV